MSRLGRRDRRAVVLGVSVLLAALLVVFGVRPYLRQMAESRDRLATDRALLARELGLLEKTPDLEALRPTLESALEARLPRLFDRDPGVALRALIRHVDGIARSTRFHLTSVEPLAGVDVDGDVRSIRLRVRGVSDIAGVLHFVREIEDGEHLVRFDQLTLQRSGQHPQDRVAEDEMVQTVTLQATLSGYRVQRNPGEEQ